GQSQTSPDRRGRTGPGQTAGTGRPAGGAKAAGETCGPGDHRHRRAGDRKRRGSALEGEHLRRDGYGLHGACDHGGPGGSGGSQTETQGAWLPQRITTAKSKEGTCAARSFSCCQTTPKLTGTGS